MIPPTFCGTLLAVQRASACVNRIGINTPQAVIVLSSMHRRLFKLFDVTPRFSLQFRDAVWVFLLMVPAVAPGYVLAQSNAPSDPQAIQVSKTSSGLPARKSGEGSLGVYVGDVNEERARELKLAEVRGAVVGKVEEGSPAATAGLQENDVILAFNEQKIFNPAQLYRFLTESAPGDSARLSISRNGLSQDVTVRLGQRVASQKNEVQRLFGDSDAMLRAAEDRVKQAEEARQRGDEKEAARLLEEEKQFRRGSEESRAAVERDLREGKIQPDVPRRFGYNVMAARHQLGVRVVELTEQLARFFNARGGVLVSELTAGGIAENTGVRAGDCITAVNGEQVNTPSDLNRLVDRTSREGKENSEVTLSIVRDRSEQTIKVRFSQR
jgi:membrane-associated protease RseP (regulator of RpoE activity)